jgi:hypothetical protein
MSDGQESLAPSSARVSSKRTYSSWKQLYLHARRESDTKKLAEIVMFTENALYERLRELDGDQKDSSERAEIKFALEELLEIKTNKLGWPNT